MNRIRDQIENAFEAWGHLAFRYPLRILAGMLVLSVVLASGLFSLELDMGSDSFLSESDSARVDYDNYRQQFMSDEVMLVVIESEDIFSFEFLEHLRAFHADLEENLLYLQDIDSLINARLTRGTEDALIVEELFENWPQNEQELDRIAAIARANPLYENTLFSESGGYAAIRMVMGPGGGTGEADALAGFEEEEGEAGTARILNNQELDELMAAWDEISARHVNSKYPLVVAGGPPFVQILMKYSVEDMAKFSALAVVVIAFLLYLIFKRASGVLLPLTTVLLPLAGTMGLMGTMGIPVTAISQIVPPFLLVVGVGDAVHIMSLFYRALDKGRTREESVAYALGHSGLAVVMTSVTTAGSLISFLFSELMPLQGFGFSAPVGIMLALLYSLVLLPALIALTPIKVRDPSESEGASAAMANGVAALGDFCTRRPWSVIGFWALLLGGSLWGASHLRLSHDALDWFNAKDEFRLGMELVDREFKGTISAEVILDTGEENGLYDPEVLAKMEQMRQAAESLDVSGVVVGKTVSVLEIVKETHQALNENRPEFYAIPTERDVIAQELLLFENSGSEDLQLVADSQLSKARMTLLLPYRDGFHYEIFLQELENEFNRILDEDLEVTVTGVVRLSARTIGAMLTSLVRSYSIALLVIVPLMILLIGDIKLGLLSMIPNLIPIAISLGMMYVLALPLDMLMMLVGSLAIGVAVDDTIHFMHNFRRYHRQWGDPQVAVHKTLVTAGRALLVTSIVLSCGFLLYTGARMDHIRNFGFVTSVTVAIAFVANVTLGPAIVCVASKKRIPEV